MEAACALLARHQPEHPSAVSRRDGRQSPYLASRMKLPTQLRIIDKEQLATVTGFGAHFELYSGKPRELPAPTPDYQHQRPGEQQEQSTGDLLHTDTASGGRLATSGLSMMETGGGADSHRDMDHELMLAADNRHLLSGSGGAGDGVVRGGGGSSSPTGLSLKQVAINNNNTEDFVSEHNKMKEAYGLYGAEEEADADCSSDRLFESNGDYNGEEEDIHGGMMVIKPMDTEIGISPAQSLLRGASRRKQLKPCGGRRKQYKPARVYTDYMEGEPSDMPQAAAGGGVPMAVEDRYPPSPNQASQKHSQMEVDESYPCDFSPPPHHPQQQQQQQQQQQRREGQEAAAALDPHNNSNDKSSHPALEAGHGERSMGPHDDSFPTKYHQLGNQLMQHHESVMTISPEEPASERARGQADRESGTPERGDPTLERPRFSPPSSQGDGSNHSQGDMPGPDGSIKSGSRIFHPDAYCELCNREFCNKYFLKTHKANKHGIYENSTSPTGHLPGGMPMPPLPNGFPNFTMPPLESMQAMPASSLPHSLPMPTMSESVARYTNAIISSNSITPIKQEHPLPPPPTSVPRLPGPPGPHPGVHQGPHPGPHPGSHPGSHPGPLSGPLPPHPSSAGPPSSSANGPKSDKSEKSMEDYCEICQKHFCNKYYLKKHKHDVHGIVPSTPTMKRSRTTPSSMCSSSGLTPVTSNSINTTSAPSHLGIPQSPLGNNGAGMPGMPNMPNMAAMANVMFINPFTPPMFIHTQPMLQPGPGGFLPNGLPALPQVPQPVPPSEPPHPSPQPRPHQDQNPPPRPPSEQHRPVPQDLQKSSRPPSSSPHNHISLPGEAPPRSSALSAPLNADAYCELCRKEFCNRYFLKIHKANKHGIFIDDDFGDEHNKPPSRNSPDKLNGPWEASRASPSSDQPNSAEKIESANKGDEVYTCKSCNKDFHSKQSFKIHNMNVHGFPRHPEDMKQLDMDMALAAKMATASGGIEAGELVNNSHHPLPMPPPPFALEGLMAKNLGLPPITSEASKLGNTMFGNMIAAKLADRVMCDICNKEVCNKYFLKTHKLKVHGITPEPPTPDKEKEKEKHRIDDLMNTMNSHAMSNGSSGPADLSMKPKDPLSTNNNNNNTPNPSDQVIKRPNDQELLKMGIDPEAYCEICKKEFCSKYFLKTHKQNIHGIKVENSIPREKHRDSHRDLSSLQTSLASMQTSLSSLSSSHMSPNLMPHMTMAPTMAPTMVPTMRPGVTNGQPGGPHHPPGLMPNLFNFHLMPEHLDMTERRTWKWKEPINATRVMCDLCNKELCNKYFLRTHMLNKHGLHWDHVTGQTTPSSKQPSPTNSKQSSASNTPSSTPPVDAKSGSIPSSSMHPTSVYDAKPPISNGSLLFPSDPHHPHHPMHQHHHHQQQLQHQLQQRSGVIVSKEGHHHHRETESGPDGKYVAHTPKSEPDLPPMMGEGHPGMSTVTAKTWHVPSVGADQPQNMTKEEGGPKGRPDQLPNGMYGGPPGSERLGHEGTLPTSAANTVNPFIQKCDLCGLLFGEPMTLHLHKVHDHGIQFPPKVATSSSFAELAQAQDARNAAAMATYSLKKKYQNNMKRKFRASRRWRRLGQNMGVIGDKVKSAIMNHIANHQRRKKYRCAHCQERFLSKPLCQAHIRSEHPNARFTEQSDSDSNKQQQPQQQQQQQQRSSELDVQASDNPMDTTEAKDTSSDRRDSVSAAKDSSSASSDLPVSYATPTPASPQPADGPPQYLMQPFTVQESAGESNNFATSIVYLPVMRKVSEAVTVSFRLTPAEQ